MNEEIRVPKVIAVWSPKAGAGKSYIASRLAKILSNDMKVALLDFDVIMPSQSYYTGTEVNNINISDAGGKKNRDVFISYFVQNSKYKNLFLLANGEEQPVTANDSTNYDIFKDIVDSSRDIFDTVIIDCPTDYMVPSSPVGLRESDRIITVINQSFLDVYAFTRYNKLLNEIGVETHKHMFVLNKKKDSVMGTGDIKGIMGIKFKYEVPFFSDWNYSDTAEDEKIDKIFDDMVKNLFTVNNTVKIKTKEKKNVFSLFHSGRKKNIKNSKKIVPETLDETDETAVTIDTKNTETGKLGRKSTKKNNNNIIIDE